jgi:hypothetical protein
MPDIQHKERFDAAGKLDADDWLILPHDELKSDFALDAALADEMVRCFLATVTRESILPLSLLNEPQGIRLQAPLGKTALVLWAPERIVDAQRAETSWRIAGGFLLAHRVDYGGRFYIGAEWQPDHALKLYSTIRRFPTRLINWFGIPRGIAFYHRTQGLAYERVQKKFLSEMASLVTRVE